MNKIQQLTELGQAVWLDYIRRSFITSGGLQALVDEGVRGVTSNPTIFDKAIAGSSDYDGALREQMGDGPRPVAELVRALMVADIQMAADVLRPVYDQTAGADGYVSLEVNPALAADTETTMAEARRLFAAANRPNVFIKVPATPAGIPAIRALIAEGMNINITLMFSLAHYEAVTEAYLAGLERLVANGGDPGRVASVASFFVSRVDTKVDKRLEAMGGGAGRELLGKIAIANSKVTYARFKEIFSGERWQRLAARGARIQRPLWASTSTKNPHYPDTLYVDSLIGPMTVNTMPQETYDAFMDHGRPVLTVEQGLDEAHAHLARLAELGIDLDEVTEELQVEGVAAFAKSFESLTDSVRQKSQTMQEA